MATPNAPTGILTPDQRIALEQQERYNRYKRNIAIGGVLICPTIALLPPRKLDLYTFSLAIGFYLSADHLAESYKGRSLLSLMTPSFRNPVSSLPTDKARETSRILKEREEAERARREGLEGLGKEREKEKKGLLGKIWMGGEEEGWKQRRLEEERKALEEGKSYTDLILEQIWEVWNWDKKKGEDGKAEGEKKE
ncbi:uncharacterized protein CC84DRAFT_1160598 [Paraphaeosphaeria sporulosa]|uniref:Uncharacterized protein n=1 Tax=Paraphaeosphaeria sporulosa TaxID=1460663 RepID=A0A177CPJ6_9PLEO|nr:uncharacterized protein CC84DRAFT_1160598 [Paraphaeosphaeria sporulosa]OAG09445.1 hypothetical protein CC84DRAFT_1160598 [Paraphaeosphaeria sporulosa]